MGAHDQGVDSSPGRWTAIPRTLCFVTNGDDLLLIKRGEQTRIFPGRYNGLGGHLERNEDPRTGAIREICEETGLSVHHVRFRGVCHIDAGEDVGILMFVFTAASDTRQLTDCDEGSLRWVPMTAIYDLPLVEDLPVLMPRLFGAGASDTPFFAHISYGGTDQMTLTFAEEG